MEAAARIINKAGEAIKDRHDKYGPPNEHFRRTVGMVNAAFGTNFSEGDWALIMTLDKIARYLGDSPTEDSLVDIAGYAACCNEVSNKLARGG